MKKQLILIGIAVLLICVGLSGCSGKKGTTDTNSNLPNGNQTNTPSNKDNETTPSDSTPPPIGIPDPYFLQTSIDRYEYNSNGTMIGMNTSIQVKNKGDPGYVFLTIKLQGKEEWNASKVFYLDKDEIAGVMVHFNGYLNLNHLPSHEFKWTVRAALPGDISQGEVYVRGSI